MFHLPMGSKILLIFTLASGAFLLVLRERFYLEIDEASVVVDPTVGNLRNSNAQSLDPFDDYGNEHVTKGADLQRNVDEMPGSNLDDGETENEETKNGSSGKKYFTCDDVKLDPSVVGTKRIMIDANFHVFTDRYGILDSELSKAELEDVLLDVCRTWMKANIWIRFRKSDLEPQPVRDEGADAARWWAFAFKDVRRDPQRFWKDVDLFLKRGPSKMSADDANKVVKRYNEFGGHSLMNWILDVGPITQMMAIDIDVFAVGLWPWYNGGAKRGRVFVRSGSCKRDLSKTAGIATDDTAHPQCPGWRLDETAMTKEEMGRILSHEFGHILGLAHPQKGACQKAASIEQLVLMAQQKSVTLDGVPCSNDNSVSKLSRYIREDEMRRARTIGQNIARYQRMRRTATAEISP